MKIYISSEGDSSVGFQGEYVVLDWNNLEYDHVDSLEFIRQELIKTFTNLFGEKSTVRFENETE